MLEPPPLVSSPKIPQLSHMAKNPLQDAGKQAIIEGIIHIFSHADKFWTV